MELVRWTPWNDTRALSGCINRMFNDSYFSAQGGNDGMTSTPWNPAVDVYEEDGAYVVKAELPGMEKKDITVDLKDGVLAVSGERSRENEAKEGKYYRRERVFGKFRRSFSVPDAVDPDKITAEFNDGVLKIGIPKPEEKKPRQVTIH